jgi:radical SAM superfamily enzyme YgiQ (UPF0313 family)
MRILWLDINSSYSHSSLAIPALHAQLLPHDESKHKWQILSGTINRDQSFYLSQISEFRPDYILSTSWLFNHIFLLTILNRAKALLPDLRIVLGGPEYLGENREYLIKNRFITAVFRGEGEDIYPQFIRHIHKESEWKRLSGFCHLDLKGEYYDNGNAVVKNFTALYPPESSRFFSWNKPFVQIETSRGCFNRCAFCISGDGRKVENIALDEIETRLDRIRTRNIKEVRVLDRTFNSSDSRASSLLNLFKKYHPDINFHLEIHPAILGDGVKEELKTTPPALLHIEAGIQSLNDIVTKECMRYGESEGTLEGLSTLLSFGKFDIHCDLIAGLPYYTLENLFSDVRKLIVASPGEIQLELLKILPGTDFERRASEIGLKYSPLPPYEILETKWITYSELSVASTLSKILDMYYNNEIWSECFSSIVKNNSLFLINFTKHIHEGEFEKLSGSEGSGLILYNFCSLNYTKSIEKIIICWMDNGLSLRSGPGLMSKQWRYGDKLHNPAFDHDSISTGYRYIDFKDKRVWFLYNKKNNSYKAFSNFIEFL